MKRLLTAGDSFTYGFNLPDRNVNKWPAVLANKLSCKLLDVSNEGVSNDYIIRKVKENINKDIGIAIIGFTSVARTEIFFNDEYVQILPGSKFRDQKLVDYHQNYYNKEFNEVESLEIFVKSVKTLERDFIDREIDYYFFCSFGNRQIIASNENSRRLENVMSSDRFIGWPYHDMTTMLYGQEKLSCGHPGKQAHVFWANLLYDFIKDSISFKKSFKKITGKEYL